MRKALTLAVAGLCAASVPAMAETTGNSVTGSAGASASTYNFTTLDTDRNGSLSLSEMTAGGLSDARVYGRIDTNRDGNVSNSELSTFNTSSASGTPTGTTAPSAQSTTYQESNPAIRSGAGRENSLSGNNANTASDIAPSSGGQRVPQSGTAPRANTSNSATSPSTSPSSGSAGMSGSSGSSSGSN